MKWPFDIMLSSELRHCKASCDEVNDRLSELPDDILLSILSRLQMKDAARIGLLSHHWNYLWKHVSALNFVALDALSFKALDGNVGPREKSLFVGWVDPIVKGHLGPSLDELSVTYGLDNTFQSHIDRWVVVALSKNVKRLRLDFRPYFSLRGNPCKLTLNMVSLRSSVTSLHLSYIDVTAEVIECILESWRFLEILYIESLHSLTCIRAPCSLLKLKRLEVFGCFDLESIDISVPNLLSFAYRGRPINLHIGKACLLSEVYIGVGIKNDIGYAFHSLAKYFSQLERLTLQLTLYEEWQVNMGISNVPAVTNLNHLELVVFGSCNCSLLGWISLIEASRLLQKLTLKFCIPIYSHARQIVIPKRPLKCLKTLEIGGFTGGPIDLELATYVLENAMMLEEVIVDFTPPFRKSPIDEGAKDRLVELEKKIPKSVKLIIK